MRIFRSAIGMLATGVLLATGLTLAAGSGAVTSAAPEIFNPPRVPVAPPTPPGPPGQPGRPGTVSTWAASNWSGYAETGTFTGISGTWTVPSVAGTLGQTTYSSAWIGVDGFNDNNLIQTGTEEDYYNGSAHYNAWWEILPAPETALPGSNAVAPGDQMKASIYETSAVSGGTKAGPGHHGGGGGGSQHTWVITISDTTRNWTYTTNQGYSGAGTSAEWIMEAPQVGGRIATLANYTFSPPSTPLPSGSGDFDNAQVTNVVGSGAPPFTNARLDYTKDSGVMIQNNAQVSTPGNPDSVATAFNVAYGKSLPVTPSG